MKIDDALLEKLQTLGMIRIDESKKEEIKKQLSDIIGFVDNLAHISTDEIQIQNTTKTPLRIDEVRDAHIREEVLSAAPKAEDGFFIVPKIIE